MSWNMFHIVKGRYMRRRVRYRTNRELHCCTDLFWADLSSKNEKHVEGSQGVPGSAMELACISHVNQVNSILSLHCFLVWVTSPTGTSI